MSETKNAAPAPREPRTGVATGRVTAGTRPGLELEALNVFIGRWITEGETEPTPDAPATKIVTSDVYQWAPGGHFILHPAYGLVGTVGVGGIEIIGYDPEAGHYRTYFFDSQGNVSTHTLKKRGDSWLWEGAHARCNGVFSDGGRTLTARHERSDDGVNWEPSMTVTLRKAD